MELARRILKAKSSLTTTYAGWLPCTEPVCELTVGPVGVASVIFYAFSG